MTPGVLLVRKQLLERAEDACAVLVVVVGGPDAGEDPDRQVEVELARHGFDDRVGQVVSEVLQVELVHLLQDRGRVRGRLLQLGHELADGLDLVDSEAGAFRRDCVLQGLPRPGPELVPLRPRPEELDQLRLSVSGFLPRSSDAAPLHSSNPNYNRRPETLLGPEPGAARSGLQPVARLAHSNAPAQGRSTVERLRSTRSERAARRLAKV